MEKLEKLAFPLEVNSKLREAYIYILKQGYFGPKFILPKTLCAIQEIYFCPFCGKKFPGSLRELWFEELRSLGHENPSDDDSIPEAYKSDKWWKERGL